MDHGIDNDGTIRDLGAEECCEISECGDSVTECENAEAKLISTGDAGPCEAPDSSGEEGGERADSLGDRDSECADPLLAGLMAVATQDEAAAAAEAARLEEAAIRREAAFREVREYVQAILLAIVLAMVIMTFIGRSFVVEGASMEPTLHNRERIIVEKVSYRFRDPVRGEVVVLKNPWRPDQSGMAAVVEAVRELVDFSGSMRPYIKRIVAVGGDRVQIRNGVLNLNGKPIDEPYINERAWSDYGPVTVPEGHVFVLGDNRNNSDDSRGSVGFLRADRIVGRAWVRYYPLNKICALKAQAIYE
ncbi:MAG: signal peptidase I [Firmicutes bacterium]|jgi:signal peptidase I|nr:signal peptidase I [Bacillota bacterium]